MLTFLTLATSMDDSKFFDDLIVELVLSIKMNNPAILLQL